MLKSRKIAIFLLVFISLLNELAMVFTIMAIIRYSEEMNTTHSYAFRPLSELEKQATHEVTIFWSIEEAPQTISVREDYCWDIINGTIKDTNTNTAYGLHIYSSWSERSGTKFPLHVEPNQVLEQIEPTLTAAISKNKDIKTIYERNLAEGLLFQGLYTLPNGGGMKYADSSGRTLKNVTDDLALYAWWRDE